jgi:hypothetical protein
MSFHCHSPNVRCLAPEQVVHLQYYTNSLFEDDLSGGSRRFCHHHHDPYHERLSRPAIHDPSVSRPDIPLGRCKKRADTKDDVVSKDIRLPVLSTAEDPYFFEFWASAIDQMVLDFCCTMADQSPMLSDAPRPSGSAMSQAVQVMKPTCQFGGRRRRRRGRSYR